MKKAFLAALVCGSVLFASCGGNSTKAEFENDTDTVSYELGYINAGNKADLIRFLSSPQAGSDSAYINEFLKGLKEVLTGAEDKKKAAYLLGMSTGMQIRNTFKMTENQVYADDSTKTFNYDNLFAGFLDGLDQAAIPFKVDGKDADINVLRADVNKRLQNMTEKAMAKKYPAEEKASKDHIAKIAKQEGFKALPGGTLYKEIKAGTGANAKDGQKATVSYTGKLIDGTVFDKTEEGKSIAMTVGRNIPGFDEALKAMKVGSTWEIHIPYDQAYGFQQVNKIKPFSALIFTVTLEKVEDMKPLSEPKSIPLQM